MTTELVTQPAPTVGAMLQSGLHYNVKASAYHADPCVIPSLSSGIARTIVAKTPAHARLEHVRLGGTSRKLTPALSLGAYVHALIAGDVSGFEVGDFPTLDSKAAKEWAEAVRSVGKEPVIERIANAAGPIADAVGRSWRRGLSEPLGTTHNEVTAIWQEGDALCRARFDRLCVDPGTYADIWDWKTADDVSDHAIARSVAEYSYHIQAAFYLRGLAAVMPEMRGRMSFVFVFVEKSPPYSVRRIVLSATALAQGARDARMAIALWQRATATNDWPAYNTDTTEIDLSNWAQDDDVISPS